LFKIERGVLFFFLGRREKGTASKCSKKEAKWNFLRGITISDFAAEKWTIEM
jgi:hypothetical protein